MKPLGKFLPASSPSMMLRRNLLFGEELPAASTVFTIRLCGRGNLTGHRAFALMPAGETAGVRTTRIAGVASGGA